MLLRPASALALLLALGCSGNDGVSPPLVERLMSQPTEVTLPQLGRQSLTVRALDESGNVLDVEVTLESLDPALVTVAGSSIISAGPAGGTVVRARAQRVSLDIPITVRRTASQVVLSETSLIVEQFGRLAITGRVVDPVGAVIDTAKLSLTSANSQFLRVIDDSTVESAGPAGTGLVTVHASGLTKTVAIRVDPVPTRIVATPVAATLRLRDTTVIVAELRDAIDAPIAGSSFVFTPAPGTAITLETVTDRSIRVIASSNPESTAVRIASGNVETSVPVTVRDIRRPRGIIHRTLQPGARRVAFSSTGRVFALRGAELVEIDTTAFSVARILNAPVSALDMAISRAGTAAFMAGFGGVACSEGVCPGLTRVDLASLTLQSVASGTVGRAFSVALSEDESRVFLATDSARIYDIDASTLGIGQSARLPAGSADQILATPVYMLFDASGGRIFASYSIGRSVAIVDAATLDSLDTYPLSGRAQGIALDSVGERLYVAIEEGFVNVIDLRSRHVTMLEIRKPLFGIALTRDGEELWVPTVGEVRRYDSRTLVSLPTILLPANEEAREVAFSADGRSAVVAGPYTLFFLH